MNNSKIVKSNVQSQGGERDVQNIQDGASDKTVKFRAQQLDIIKAVSIFFVVAFHYFPAELNWHLEVMPSGWFENYWHQALFQGVGNFFMSFFQFLGSYLYVGVNMFVIASGFGLYFSYLKSGKPLNLKEFFLKRIWRLMPAAFFSIVVVFFVKWLFMNQLVTNGFLLNFYPFLAGLNLFSNQWLFPPINGDSWFLGLIIQLYLFFPLLVWLYEKLGEKKFLILLLAVSVAFRSLYYIFWKDTISSLSYTFSIGRLFEFGFGMVCAKNFFDGKKINPWWILAIFFGLGYFWPLSFPFADSLFGVGAFVLLWFTAAKFPQWKGWGKIALQSYLIFLLHHPFIWIVQGWGFKDEYSLVGLVVLVLLFTFSYFIAKIAQMVLDWITRVFVRGKFFLRTLR